MELIEFYLYVPAEHDKLDGFSEVVFEERNVVRLEQQFKEVEFFEVEEVGLVIGVFSSNLHYNNTKKKSQNSITG